MGMTHRRVICDRYESFVVLANGIEGIDEREDERIGSRYKSDS